MAQDHVSYLAVDHIPVVAVGREGAPLALWVPPLGMTKDDMRPVLESLAGAGFRAVSFDPWQHGERGSESADEIRARVFTDFRRHMWPIIGQTTLDCLRVIDYFGGGPVVAGGTSMGGDVAAALAGIDHRVTRVAAIVATPDWTRPGMRDIRDASRVLPQGEADAYAQWFFDRFDPLTHVDNYAHGPAILFECGADDMHVPPDGAQRFAAALGEDVRVNVRAGLGHIDGASSPELIDSCIAWLRGDAVKHLRASVFGRGARDYDRVGTPIFGRLGRRLVELAGVHPGDRVLDVATGRGAVLFAAIERAGERGRVIGVDLAEEMVALTSADIRARRITNAEVRVADAERLSEFMDGEFDCVTCAFAIFFLPAPESALREFCRVLRPGGTVALSSWGRANDPRDGWYRELRREFGVSVNLETRAFDTPDELGAALSASGFTDVRVSTERALLRFNDPEQWWRWLLTGGGRATVEALDRNARARFQEAAFERIRDVYEGGAPEFDEEALLAVAKKPRV